MLYYVYILSNANNRVLYTGVTNDLIRRVYEHKHHLDKGSFTDQYNVTRLVYYEETSSSRAAIEREKQIKGWNRNKNFNYFFRIHTNEKKIWKFFCFHFLNSTNQNTGIFFNTYIIYFRMQLCQIHNETTFSHSDFNMYRIRITE